MSRKAVALTPSAPANDNNINSNNSHIPYTVLSIYMDSLPLLIFTTTFWERYSLLQLKEPKLRGLALCVSQLVSSEPEKT